MEEFKENKSDDIAEAVEKQANFEGHESNLLFERVANPVIKNQIIDLIYQARLVHAESIKNETWRLFLPDGWTGDEKIKLIKGEKSGKVLQDKEIEYGPPSREEIEKEINETIAEAMTITNIDFSSNSPTVDCIPLDWKMPGMKVKPTLKQKTIMLAHEKGHKIRSYHGKFYDKYFLPGFDPSKIDFTERDFEIYKLNMATSQNKLEDKKTEDMTFEEARSAALEYLFSGAELAERMSQLKGYFGMREDDQFTIEHLRYAREHYISDTNMDNSMVHFFQSITPETEDEFIRIINSAGI